MLGLACCAMVCGDRSDSAIAAWGRHDGTELQKKNMASPFKTLRNAVDISDTGMSSSYFSTMPGENLSTDRANHCHIKALGYVPASASVTSGGAAPPERVSAKDNARGRRRPRTAHGERALVGGGTSEIWRAQPTAYALRVTMSDLPTMITPSRHPHCHTDSAATQARNSG